MELSLSKYSHTAKISLHDEYVQIHITQQALKLRIKYPICAVMGEAATIQELVYFFFLVVSKANPYISKT